MIDPIKFTNYKLSDIGLQEYILFCIAVAGKPALLTAKLLHQLIGNSIPFEVIKSFETENNLKKQMKSLGFGCYNLKSKGFWWIANSGINLRNCSVNDLEECPGIGMKTSRFFILHTRPDANVACLDTHILKFMKEQGFNVPKHTPTKKKYVEIEKRYLEICKNLNKNPAKFDLEIWNYYAGYENKH